MLVHYLESTEARRKRLQSETVHAQALCSNGSAHAKVSTDPANVTCGVCLRLLTKE